MNLGLSKSRYCKGIQCPKILWMDQNMPDKADDVLPESVMETGNRVGELARGYFGKYDLVEYNQDKTVMKQRTDELIANGSPNIAEASFFIDGLYCAVDILHLCEDGYSIIEVKSSTHVTDIYVEDMAFQYYVLKRSGVKIKKVCLMHLDNSYVRHGELQLEKLFALEDYTEQVKEKYTQVEKNIKKIRSYVDTNDEPERDIDLYCENPYLCVYYSYCSRHLPEQSIFDVRRLKASKKYDYYHNGIISFEDIVNHNPDLSEKQRKQVEIAYFDRPADIDIARIKEFLNSISYPIYHLDFETFQQAIPEYDGLSPYSQIPFQYSLHIEQEDGRLEHREFLAKEGTDPRRAIAESLCNDFPQDAYVLAYNMSFERGVLQRLAESFPDLAEHLTAIHDNVHDLMIPFQQQYYYCKEMQGSYSIKYVLPALCPGDPELDYQNLEQVHNGSEASAAFADMANHSPEEIKEIRENLLKYCGLDTLAMVKVLGKLKEVVR